VIIEDDPSIADLLDLYLREGGFRPLQAASGMRGLELVEQHQPALVVLDIGLPDIDGHHVLSRVREWSQVPVIMLTVRAGESEKVAALDAGANDYVTKPFGTQELMARVRVLLRQAAQTARGETLYDDGRLRVDLERREVSLDRSAVVLTRKEYALLALLVRHAGRVVTLPQILREVWGATHVEDTHYVRILVAKLRQKLGDDPTHPVFIATEPGVGLKLLAR